GLEKSSTNLPPNAAVPEPSGGDTRPHTRMRGDFRELYHFTEREHCILVGRSIVAEVQAWHRFAWLMAVAGAGVLALGLGGGWIIATRALQPVHQISASARRISEGNLSERINIADTDSELGHLAGVLNSTFAR